MRPKEGSFLEPRAPRRPAPHRTFQSTAVQMSVVFVNRVWLLFSNHTMQPPKRLQKQGCFLWRAHRGERSGTQIAPRASRESQSWSSTNLPASVAIFSKESFTNEFMIDMAFRRIPVWGGDGACFITLKMSVPYDEWSACLRLFSPVGLVVFFLSTILL